MFQLLSKHSFSLVRTYADQVFLGFRASDGERHLFPYSLDGELGEELKFSKKGPISWIYLRSGLWLIQYEGASKEDTHIYSIEGEWQQTIPHIHADLYILKTEKDWVYLINNRFVKYNLSTHEYRDLGQFSLKKPFLYKGCHYGLHFFTCEGQSQLVAMRDKDGQGLEEVYRLDFAESGRGYSGWHNGIVPGEIDFINFYGSDLWVTTQEHLHRIDVATGKVLERQNEYRDLGQFSLKKPFLYKGCHYGLHFFTCEGQSQLVAMRDKDGQGLEEVYRLDFAESGRGYSGWHNGIVPGEIDFINFYGSDLWVTTQEHLHRIDVATGMVLERQDEILPKMFIKGSIGYSLCYSYYTVFDFEAGRMLCNERRDRFVREGKEGSAGYTGLLLRDGIFYVSVRVSDTFFLAAFDVQTEKFVWHIPWDGWDIESIHIIGDRMIAYSQGKVYIYEWEESSGVSKARECEDRV